MNCNKINLILPISFMILVSYSFSSNAKNELKSELDYQNLSFSEMSKKVKAKYTKNKKTNFDNFHEEFMVMQSLGFPHVRKNFFPVKFNEKNIHNPQAIFSFEEKLLQQDEITEKSKETNYSHPSPVNRKEVRQIREQINQYAKEGYYSYYRDLLKSKKLIDQSATVNVCIDLDLEIIGFSQGSAEKKSYRQQLDSRNIDIVNAIESHLPVGTYSNVILEDFCDACLDITQTTLEFIYNARFIKTIRHSDNYLNSIKSFKAF